MKNIIILLLFTISSLTCYSQHMNEMPQGRKHKGISRQEVESQKIAYFTQVLELTPEEAQKFWPVYNAQGKKKNDARKATLNSLRLLNDALEATPIASDEEINKLVNNYLERYNQESKIFKENYEEIKKILPLSKAAKLFNAEEKFRVILIRQLRGQEQ